MALIAVVVCMGFTACSNDDESPKPGETDLSKVLIGTWTLGGERVIWVFNPDGTITCYSDEEDYKNKEVEYIEFWKVINNDCVYVFEREEDSEPNFIIRPLAVSNDNIKWKFYNSSELDADLKDEYGYYSVWTWTRYNK